MTKLVLTSFAKKTQAVAFAKKLISDKLAACAMTLPGATSVFRWKGKAQTTTEALLLIKTSHLRLGALEKFFKRQHPYELPQYLVLSPTASKKFGAWIENEVKS